MGLLFMPAFLSLEVSRIPMEPFLHSPAGQEFTQLSGGSQTQ